MIAIINTAKVGVDATDMENNAGSIMSPPSVITILRVFVDRPTGIQPILRQQPAEPRTQHRADIRHPAIQADIFHIKAERIDQINRDPEHEQPPDRVDKHRRQDSAPALLASQHFAG